MSDALPDYGLPEDKIHDVHAASFAWWATGNHIRTLIIHQTDWSDTAIDIGFERAILELYWESL
jgi:hypothetical protein